MVHEKWELNTYLWSERFEVFVDSYGWRPVPVPASDCRVMMHLLFAAEIVVVGAGVVVAAVGRRVWATDPSLQYDCRHSQIQD